MIWQATAPSNIALIKYMGCQKVGERLPANPSLSYTLKALNTRVELELSEQLTEDCWQTFPNNPYCDSIIRQVHNDGGMIVLSELEQARFLNHLKFLKTQFNFKGYFIVRSANNFQSACGLASSASSFAALTLCAVKALSELCPSHRSGAFSVETMANWSRQASGSSCRSFFSPWALWEGESVRALDLPYPELIHQVVLVDTQKKLISSSEAHRRVLTSPLFAGRAERAADRLKQLLQAMHQQNWPSLYEITREEFLDMHRLFESATEKFSYRQAATLQVLDYWQDYWQKNGDGPLVTMDAGPNVHLLFRPDQADRVKEIMKILPGMT